MPQRGGKRYADPVMSPYARAKWPSPVAATTAPPSPLDGVLTARQHCLAQLLFADGVRNVFTCLPLSSLVSAALTCRAWYAATAAGGQGGNCTLLLTGQWAHRGWLSSLVAAPLRGWVAHLVLPMGPMWVCYPSAHSLDLGVAAQLVTRLPYLQHLDCSLHVRASAGMDSIVGTVQQLRVAQLTLHLEDAPLSLQDVQAQLHALPHLPPTVTALHVVLHASSSRADLRPLLHVPALTQLTLPAPSSVGMASDTLGVLRQLQHVRRIGCCTQHGERGWNRPVVWAELAHLTQWPMLGLQRVEEVELRQVHMDTPLLASIDAAFPRLTALVAHHLLATDLSAIDTLVHLRLLDFHSPLHSAALSSQLTSLTCVLGKRCQLRTLTLRLEQWPIHELHMLAAAAQQLTALTLAGPLLDLSFLSRLPHLCRLRLDYHWAEWPAGSVQQLLSAHLLPAIHTLHISNACHGNSSSMHLREGYELLAHAHRLLPTLRHLRVNHKHWS